MSLPHGGGGISSAGIDAAFPTAVRGDILRRNAALWDRYALGANGTILSSNGTDVTYQTAAALNLVTTFKYSCNFKKATLQTHNSSGSYLALTLDTAIFNNGGFTIASNTRLTTPVAGLAIVFARLGFTSNSTGERGLDIQKNGSPIAGSATFFPAGTESNGWYSLTNFMVSLVANDYLEIRAFQSSGGNLDTDPASTTLGLIIIPGA